MFQTPRIQFSVYYIVIKNGLSCGVRKLFPLSSTDPAFPKMASNGHSRGRHLVICQSCLSSNHYNFLLRTDFFMLLIIHGTLFWNLPNTFTIAFKKTPNIRGHNRVNSSYKGQVNTEDSSVVTYCMRVSCSCQNVDFMQTLPPILLALYC